MLNLSFICILIASISLCNGSPVEVESSETPIVTKPQDGSLFEGDIAGVDPHTRGGYYKKGQFWKKGEVPYYITSSFSSSDVRLIKEALSHIETMTKKSNGKQTVKFVQVTSESSLSRYKNAIKVVRGLGCYSYVGMQKKLNPQDLSLGYGCVYHGTIVHEFMHALGFVHEHSRPDRDNYLTIYMQNVRDGAEANFDKYSTSDIGQMDFGYDYNSVMHYDMYSFSKNGLPTMVPKSSTATIGDKVYLSSQDAQEIIAAYSNSGNMPKTSLINATSIFAVLFLSFNLLFN